MQTMANSYVNQPYARCSQYKVVIACGEIYGKRIAINCLWQACYPSISSCQRYARVAKKSIFFRIEVNMGKRDAFRLFWHCAIKCCIDCIEPNISPCCQCLTMILSQHRNLVWLQKYNYHEERTNIH